MVELIFVVYVFWETLYIYIIQPFKKGEEFNKK